MSDIRVVWDAERMLGDWLLRGNVLDTTAELVTAIAVSLFTHRTAEADDPLPHFAADRRGWWGDHEADEIHGGTPIGSRLWLLSREKQTQETRLRAEEYIREALAWVTELGVASRVDVAVDWFAHERLGAEIVLTRGPQESIAVRFESLWDEIVNGPAPVREPPRQPDQTFAPEFAQELA